MTGVQSVTKQSQPVGPKMIRNGLEGFCKWQKISSLQNSSSPCSLPKTNSPTYTPVRRQITPFFVAEKPETIVRQQITPFFVAEKPETIVRRQITPFFVAEKEKDRNLHGGNHLQHPQEQAAEPVHQGDQEGGAEVQGVQGQHEHGR